MEVVVNETKINLLKEVGIGEGHNAPVLDQIADKSRYIKDLKINVSNFLNTKNLNKKEALLIALATAVNDKSAVLQEGLLDLAKQEGASEEEVAEIYAAVSLLNVNNVFYRFRHFTGNEYYNNTPAGIKMSVMMNPVLGKEFFELVSLVVSALNGCELCVNSHDDSVKKHGASEERIYEAIRLGAVIRGLTVVL
jgi:alkyl hydroperoxide reductase subunit D